MIRLDTPGFGCLCQGPASFGAYADKVEGADLEEEHQILNWTSKDATDAELQAEADRDPARAAYLRQLEQERLQAAADLDPARAAYLAAQRATPATPAKAPTSVLDDVKSFFMDVVKSPVAQQAVKSAIDRTGTAPAPAAASSSALPWVLGALGVASLVGTAGVVYALSGRD